MELAVKRVLRSRNWHLSGERANPAASQAQSGARHSLTKAALAQAFADVVPALADARQTRVTRGVGHANILLGKPRPVRGVLMVEQSAGQTGSIAIPLQQTSGDTRERSHFNDCQRQGRQRER